MVVAPYSDPAEVTDETYPLILTSGRVVSHFLSGNQTRRIGPLMDQCPDPYIEIHPKTAAQLGVEHGQWATLTTRRGDVTLRAMVVKQFDLIRFLCHITGVGGVQLINVPLALKIRCRKFLSIKYAPAKWCRLILRRNTKKRPVQKLLV